MGATRRNKEKAMDKSPNHRDPNSTMIDDWVQTALSDALLRIVDNDWLDICEVDRVTRAIDHIRRENRLPERDGQSAPQYAGLVALHCVNYREMNRATLAGVPNALLTVFGLNDMSGPLFLGTERWSEVRSRFQRHKSGISEQNAIASPPGPQIDVEPVTRGPRMRMLFGAASVRANVRSAKHAVARLLRRALERTRAVWEQPTTIWTKIPKPAEPYPNFVPLSSPSHPACHQFRDDTAPSCAFITAAKPPGAFLGPSDVGAQGEHEAAEAREIEWPLLERRLAPRSDQGSGLGRRRARHAGRADKTQFPYYDRRDSKS
jgi:hypothetical protein